MQVGDIQDESQDESQDEAMPEDPGAELSGKYDSLLSVLKSIFFLQDKIIQESEVILYPIWIIQFTFQSLYSLNSIICRN
jgi:hypothetical protein